MSLEGRLDEPTPKVWLIGGTQESAALAIALTKAEIPFVVTVTTDAAEAMYAGALEQSSQAQIQVGGVAPEAMADWLSHHGIVAVLDGSHPFATAVSAGAIAAATQAQCPYLRFERAVVQPSAIDPAHRLDGLATSGDLATSEGLATQVTLVPSLEALLTPEQLSGQRVLLVLGYRMLPYFQSWQQQSKLFARILPSQIALAAALAAGFTSDRLIALRPPISRDLERALWQQWGITKVIAKCSGQAGGEIVKRAIATELGIQLCLIQRPAVDYPAQTSDVEAAIAFAQQALAHSAC